MSCFLRGTLIQTPGGEVPVEALRTGDLVQTLSSMCLPIKWIGHRKVKVGSSRERHMTAPVRIRQSSFDEGMPHRDLLVSPGHAIFVDGMLICVRQLINGTTIRQESEWNLVEYFHVELDFHDILLAEGLAAESYLDTNNRGFFVNGGMPLILHPDLTDKADYPKREAHSCAPFASDEARVRPVWQRLSERAASLGSMPPTADAFDDSALHLVAAGKIIQPNSVSTKAFIFVLPRGITEVRLVSRAGSPIHKRPLLDHRRTLGVRVKRIVLRDATEFHDIPIDHPGLRQGWCAVERDEQGMRRWTNGDAILPLPGMGGPNILEIHLCDMLTYVKH
jgi:Hint domain